MKALAVILALGVVAAPALSLVEERPVQITDQGFKPDKIEIKAGQKVVWTNSTLKDHSVVASMPAEGRDAQDKDKPLFDSGPIKPGGSFSYTFATPGTFGYHCSFDKAMKGTVVVKAAP